MIMTYAWTSRTLIMTVAWTFVPAITITLPCWCFTHLSEVVTHTAVIRFIWCVTLCRYQVYLVRQFTIIVVGMAKNRLNKFYNPKLYKPPPAAAALAEVPLTWLTSRLLRLLLSPS